MPNLTTNYNFKLPLVNSLVDANQWGDQLNSNWSSTDDFLLTATNELSNQINVGDSPYNVQATDQNKVILVDASGGDVTVNLLDPVSAGDGFKVSVKKVDSTENTVTIVGNIDGVASSVLGRPFNVNMLVSDGTAGYNSLTSNQSTLLTPSVDIDFAASPYTVDGSDQNKILLVDATGGDVNINLNTSSNAGNGFEIIVKKIDASANVVNINADGAETIDGQNVRTLDRQYELINIIADGFSNWNSAIILDYLSTADVGTDPNDIVALDGSGRLPAVDGSQLTNLPPQPAPLITQNFTNAVNVNFTGLDSFSTSYRDFLFSINLTLTSPQEALRFRTSTNNGASYDAGTNNYSNTNSNGAGNFGWIGDLGGTNNPTYEWTLICRLLQPGLPKPTYLLNHGTTSGIPPASASGTYFVNDAGYRVASQQVNAIRFGFDNNFSSNTATGSITMYGFPN
jgi:hypothetical protein